MLDILQKKNQSNIVTTLTDELYLPARVYYKIHNTPLLKKTLRKLKCIQFYEEDPNCFSIFYYKEAKKLDLAIHYQEIEEGFYPLSIAECIIRSNSILHVDTESSRRAIELMGFLEKNIPYNLIEIISFAHMNKAFTSNEDEDFDGFSQQDYDNAFDDLVCNDKHGVSDQMKEALDLDPSIDLPTDQEKKEIIDDFLGQYERENYPDAEKLSIEYNRANYHYILNILALRSVIKENVAYKHFEGHQNYTSLDAIQEIIDRDNSDNH
jgi:hypothetical protein